MNKTLLVLGGLLLIIVGISSGCIGGKGDGGGADSDVTGASGTEGGAGVQQPETTSQTTPKTETQTVEKPVIVETGKVLTPSEETAKKFLIAVSEEDYTTAIQYVDKDYLKKLQGFFGGQTDEEILYNAVKRAPEYYGPGVSEIRIIDEFRSSKEMWSAKDGRPVKYETAGVNFEVFSTEKNKRISQDLKLMKKERTWKIIRIGGL